MNNNTQYDTIKKTVNFYLPGTRILLFGYHALGNNDNNSDYDLLIVTPNILTRKEKLSISSQLHRAIVKAIHAPIDLLLYSEDEVAKKRVLPGHIVGIALKEGIVL